jgi:predicted thioesterase
MSPDMTQDIPAGAAAAVSRTVTDEVAAAALARGAAGRLPAVFATPFMIADMERACAEVLAPLLAPGEVSVGARIEVRHLAPTPVGVAVTATARYVGREGALHWFEVRAEDPGGVIGEGRIARAVVDEARLMARAAGRTA